MLQVTDRAAALNLPKEPKPVVESLSNEMKSDCYILESSITNFRELFETGVGRELVVAMGLRPSHSFKNIHHSCELETEAAASTLRPTWIILGR